MWDAFLRFTAPRQANLTSSTEGTKALCVGRSGQRQGAVTRLTERLRRGLDIANPANNAASEDGIAIVEDHRLSGSHRRLGLVKGKDEPFAPQGDAARGRSVGIPDLGVGPLGEVRNEEIHL